MNQENKLPKVALVGRPNVGKSTLFNRLLRQRRAITDPTPGVTRDPIEVETLLGGRRITLVDTGGYQSKGGEIDTVVTRRSVAKAREADLIILVLDVMELTLEDENFISLLRPYSDRILVALNKVDAPERESRLWDFYSLGFEQILGISAAHGRGIEELEERILKLLPAPTGQEAYYHADLRLAILGKPNAGKSTLTNRLTGYDLSIVSDMPGTTRDLIEGRFEYKGKAMTVVDTAGIRRKGKVNEDVEYYSVNRAIKSIKDADVCLLLIDAIEGLSEQDKKIAWQIVKEGRGLILGVNKWDLLPKTGNVVEAYAERVRFQFPAVGFAPIVPLTALDGKGVDDLLKTVIKVDSQLRQRIETPKLNEMLKYWMEDLPTPQIRGKVYKIRYLTQVSAHPVKFVAFGNHDDTPGSLQQYLINRIRKDLGFDSVPVELEVKGK